MNRSMGVLLTAILMMLAASSVYAQTAGERYRAPVRRIEVTKVTDTSVTYRVLESELTPSTVGNTYTVKRATFVKDYVLEPAPAPAEEEPSPSEQPADTTTPAPADPSSPAPIGTADLAFTNFDSGSSAPFTTSSGSTTGNADIQLIGGAARFRYARLSTTVSADVNRALRWVHPTGIGLGQTIFFGGDVMIPAPAANMVNAQRKLFYVQRQQNDLSFFFLKQESQHLKVELTGNRVFTLGDFGYDRWYRLEVQITGSSAVGKPDGVLRVWVDGALVLDRADINWFTSSAPFVKFLFGQQTQHQLNDKSITFDEYRYWDNLAVSTRRIGQ